MSIIRFARKAYMHKKELKALVEQIHTNLVQKVDRGDVTSKEHILEYLKDMIGVVSAIELEDIESVSLVKKTFNNFYKDIAKESLESYSDTSSKIGELAQLQQETILECNDRQIDIEKITAKFSDIQSHMELEVKKANSIINELTSRVKQLEETSNLDALTKVFNRRALDNYLEDVFKSKMYKDFHLLMLDIDNFKHINDTYGHVVGDKILIFIAALLRKTLRDSDRIFRYGGEEFAIILDRSTNEQAKAIASRLLGLIKTNNLIYLGQKIEVTASIGMTSFRQEDVNSDELLQRADKALYISKQTGKNRVTEAYL